MTMLRLLMLSRLVALAAVTAGTAHADLLKVTCDKPGGWTISHRTVSLAPGVEETTVKKHITNMLKKTGYRNRVELAVNARVAGLVIGGI